MATFIKLTRVFVKKGAKTINEQSITVAVAAVASVRASNRLGYPEHRATVTLTNGQIIDVAEKFSAVNKLLGTK